MKYLSPHLPYTYVILSLSVIQTGTDNDRILKYTWNRILETYTNKLLNKIQGYCTRNALHGLYTIAKSEGLTGVQKGLVPGLWYQMTMNGLRLGMFQILTNLGYTTTPTGEYSIPRNIAASAVAGGLATWVGSPFYLVSF